MQEASSSSSARSSNGSGNSTSALLMSAMLRSVPHRVPSVIKHIVNMMMMPGFYSLVEVANSISLESHMRETLSSTWPYQSSSFRGT